MVLMRRLLVDVQAKFRKMMADNKALASRIDQDIQNAHHQVSQLRAELADTNQRLNEICSGKSCSVTLSEVNAMAGNVITTCMPPTSTTNTVTSTSEGRWEKDGRESVASIPKKEAKAMPLVDGKVQGRTTTSLVTNQTFPAKNHSDPGLRSSKPESSRTGSAQSHPCSRKGSKEKSDAPSRFRAGFRSEGRVSPARDGQSNSRPTEAAQSSSKKQETASAANVAKSITEARASPKRITNSQNDDSPRESSAVPPDGKLTSQAGPSESTRQAPVAVGTGDKSQKPSDSTTVITKESQTDQREFHKQQETNWITSAFRGPLVETNPSSKETQVSRGSPDKQGALSDKESRPYYNSWCSDTGDSVSDILTSDECMRDQNDIPEADRLASVPKTFGEEKRSGERTQVAVSGYRSSLKYSSFRSAQESRDGCRSLESDNDSLRIKCSALQRDLEEVMESRDEKAKENAAMAAKLERLENEVKHAKESLSTLKQDRKRLKAEKFDLLTQMKQLYSTLEDKEAELREFIRNYEQKMKDSDEALKQLRKEREELEKDKWSLLQRARDEAERCVLLCTQIGLKDAHIKELQEELEVLREKHLAMEQGLRQANGYGSPGSVSFRTVNGLDSSRGTPTPTPGSDPTTSSSYTGTPTIAIQYSVSKEAAKACSSSQEEHRPSLLSRSAEDIFNSGCGMDDDRQKTTTLSKKGKEKKGSTWGSISRVFSRNKQRRKALDPDIFQNSRTSWSPKSSVCSSSPLSEESYNQKLRLLEETHGTPMQHWRAATVLAWLEITMDMPQYGTMCAENIKSGKVLLELSDAELEEGLGISNVMHRRKLRLAIEEHREPSLCRYPKICLMTHSWVVEEWLPSIALTCYLPIFSEHLVDGRVLDTVTKKDLEKYFGITRKFHQMSIIHGIHLLRMLHFDRQILNQRRMNSENMDVDPLVWSNQRFIKWAASIDLGEYAENLRNSGVHGALAVLETSFTAETMATALGIPASKNIIRRHLTTEWQSLIQPARLSLESESVVAKKSKSEKRLVSGSSSTSLASQGGKSSNGLVQSYARRTLDRYDRRRTSWRFSTWRSSQESLKSTCSKKAATTAQQTPIVERPRLLPLSPKLNSSRHRRTFSSHSDVETLTVTPV